MHLKYSYYSSAGTVNSPENLPTNQGGGKGSIIRKMVRVRIYILEFCWYFMLVMKQFFSLLVKGQKTSSFTGFKTLLDFAWSLPRYNEEFEGGDKVYYWGTQKPDTLKSARFKIKWLCLKVVKNFFCFRKHSNTRWYIKLTAQSELCLRLPGICV